MSAGSHQSGTLLRTIRWSCPIRAMCSRGDNFHGQPVALAMDMLGIAVSELANVSERRIAKLVDPALNHGLPAFLVKEGGINCGFMVPVGRAHV